MSETTETETDNVDEDAEVRAFENYVKAGNVKRALKKVYAPRDVYVVPTTGRVFRFLYWEIDFLMVSDAQTSRRLAGKPPFESDDEMIVEVGADLFKPVWQDLDDLGVGRYQGMPPEDAVKVWSAER